MVEYIVDILLYIPRYKIYTNFLHVDPETLKQTSLFGFGALLIIIDRVNHIHIKKYITFVYKTEEAGIRTVLFTHIHIPMLKSKKKKTKKQYFDEKKII